MKKLIDFVGCKGSAFCWVGGYYFFYVYGLFGKKCSLMWAVFAIFVLKKEILAVLGAMTRVTATIPYYIYV